MLCLGAPVPSVSPEQDLRHRRLGERPDACAVSGDGSERTVDEQRREAAAPRGNGERTLTCRVRRRCADGADEVPAWRAYDRAVSGNDAVGVWHETFLVPAGQYEAVYRAMPLVGLAAAASVAGATGERLSASGRLGRSVEAEP